MIVGCYDLALYCDDPGEHGYDKHMREFTGRTEAEGIRAARKAGWMVRKRGGRKSEDRVLCPIHNPYKR